MINKKWSIVLVVIMIVGCTQGEKSNNMEILLKVDKHAMSLAEFNDAFELSQIVCGESQMSDPGSEKMPRVRFLRQLLEEMVILRRAEELNLTISAQALDKAIDTIRKDYPDDSFDKIFLKEVISYNQWKEKIRERLLTEKVIQADLLQNISATAEEIKLYYNEHKETFWRPETVRLYQILLPAKDQAKKILNEIKKGALFQDMARDHSNSPDKDKGGDLGFVAKGILPEVLDRVIFKLKEGGVSQVVKSDYGYHLFLVTEKKPASRPELSRLTETISKRIKEEKLEQVYGSWLAKLRSRYDVRVNEELLGP